MRLLTWNIQSGGGKRLPSIVAEIERLAPDFVALTEVTSTNFETLRQSLQRQGFSAIATTCGDGRVNSVLLASRVPFSVTEDSIPHDPERWLSVEIDSVDLKVLCVHIPGSTDNKFGEDGYGLSGKRRKEMFWDQVIEYAQQHKAERTILLGDFNTGLPEDAQGTPFELSDRMRVLRLEKYVDTWRHLHPAVREFTWYTKRKDKETGTSEDLNGFRLDYIFVSQALRECIVSAEHVHRVRHEGISDHAMLWADVAVGDLPAPAHGRASPAPEPAPSVRPRAELDAERLPTSIRSAPVDPRQKPGDWTRKEFVDALDDPPDRKFMLRILELVDSNSRLPRKGSHSHLYFGVRPGGAIFVYPYGLRHPPFKFSIGKDGSLMISGCWTKFPKVKGHAGFRELATMLGLDETGPETAVPVAGLDPDEVWNLGVRVSAAINA